MLRRIFPQRFRSQHYLQQKDASCGTQSMSCYSARYWFSEFEKSSSDISSNFMVQIHAWWIFILILCASSLPFKSLLLCLYLKTSLNSFLIMEAAKDHITIVEAEPPGGTAKSKGLNLRRTFTRDRSDAESGYDENFDAPRAGDIHKKQVSIQVPLPKSCVRYLQGYRFTMAGLYLCTQCLNTSRLLPLSSCWYTQSGISICRCDLRRHWYQSALCLLVDLPK
jgi:hypothetical protein